MSIRFPLRVLFLAWSAILLILSVYTPEWLHIDPPFPYPDKWKHFAGSFILAFLFRLSWPRFAMWKSLLIWIIISFAAEFLQPLATAGHREAELNDILFNIAGFAAFMMLNLIAKTGKNKL